MGKLCSTTEAMVSKHLKERAEDMRGLVLLLAVMAMALVLASGGVLAVNRIGINGPDTLKGTNGADSLLGKGGNDDLFGLGAATTC